jgi:nucleoside-diphosphate-sugar epimerase
LIEGIWRLFNSDYVGPMNIGSKAEISMLELAHLIIRITGSDSQVVHRELPPDDPKVRRADNTLARETLGWEPRVDPEEGLRRTAEYFRGALEKRARGSG